MTMNRLILVEFFSRQMILKNAVYSCFGIDHWVHFRSRRYSTCEPRCEKTGLRGFRPDPTQPGLYSHRR